MYFSLLFFSMLSLASVVLGSPMPMGIDPVTGVGNSDDKPATPENIKNNAGNKQVLDDSLVKANEHIGKMKAVLANPSDPKHKDLIVSAFGQHAYDHNLAEITDTVSKIDQANVRTRLTTQKTGAFVDPNTIGVTKWLEDGKGTNQWKTDSVSYGAKFFDKGTSTEARAGTMIHEAAHYTAKAGDHFDTATNTITVDDPGSGVTGYTQSHELPKDIAGVTADTGYTAVRDKATNMHQNAESYAVFSSLCGHARRDIHNFRRALQARDYEEIENILRRNADSCELPPDYFKKKAAAKAAAAAKTITANDKKLLSSSKSPKVPGARGPLAKPALGPGGKVAKTVSHPGTKSAGRDKKGAKSLLSPGGKTKTSSTRSGAKIAGGRGVKGGESLPAAGGKKGAKSLLAGGGKKGTKSLLAGGKKAKTLTTRPGAKIAGGGGKKGTKSLLAGGKKAKTLTTRPGAKIAGGGGKKGGKSLLAGGKAKTLTTRPGAKIAGGGKKGTKSILASGKKAKTLTPRPGVKIVGGGKAKTLTTRPGAKSTGTRSTSGKLAKVDMQPKVKKEPVGKVSVRTPLKGGKH